MIRDAVVVTGADGFVGRVLCRQLVKHGHVVVAAVRCSAPIPDCDPALYRQVPVGDITAFRDWMGILGGVSGVIHLAARVHVLRESEADSLGAFRHVNVEGTRAVYAAAREAGVKRVVFLSSVKAMGEGAPTPYRESDASHPVDSYGTSKLEAEQVLADGRAAGGPEFVVLRPPLVYGPGVRGNFQRLLRLATLSGRVPLPLGRIANRRSLVSITNLVSAIEAAALHPAAADQTFLVSDGEDLSTSELVAKLAEGLGKPAMFWPCPVSLARAVASGVGRKAEADRLLGSLTVDSSKIRERLGWHPPQRVAEGLKETADWWRRARVPGSAR